MSPTSIAVPSGAQKALPLVSILIPCYNSEAWVGQSIRSALDLRYPNKEVIVLDDGSTDASRRVIEAFGDQIRFEPGRHAGANAARNRLTEMAQGEWLQYLDADDFLLPGKICQQVELLNRRGGKVDVIYSPMICHNERDPRQDRITRIASDDELLNFLRWEPFNTIGMLLRRDAVISVGLWNEDQQCCQEHELLLRMLMGEYRFAPSRTPAAVARYATSSTVSRKDPLRVIRRRMDLTDQAARHFSTTPRWRREHQKALFVARMESARSAYRFDPDVAEELRAQAMGGGRSWWVSSTALPLRYRLACLTVGFQRAEQLAEWSRRTHGASTIEQSPQVAQTATSPLVSILIPCHNAAPWIGQCIRSALDQDYPNKEVIVMDDGSTDGSRAIIEAFGDRIQLHAGKRAGANAARNQLTSVARGEWLQYLDADDYLLQGKLSSQLRRVHACGNAVDAMCSPVVCYSILRPLFAMVMPLADGDASLNFIRWGSIQTTGMLFRREALLSAGGWREGQPCCQEHELLLRMITAGRKCVFGSEPLSVYRVDSGESVSRKDPVRVIRTRMELTRQMIVHLRTQGCLTQEHRKAFYVACMEAARSAYAKGDAELAEQLYKEGCASGRWWRVHSNALPLRYRLALFFFGFNSAERLADSARTLLTRIRRQTK